MCVVYNLLIFCIYSKCYKLVSAMVFQIFYLKTVLAATRSRAASFYLFLTANVMIAEYRCI